MKVAKVLHNPKAGGGEYNEKTLKKLVESSGFACRYSSTKEKGWEKFDTDDVDLVILAGGDGTIRKAVGTLLDKQIPIGLIPLGTANNIARTLGVMGEPQQIVEAWNHKHIKKYDVGRIYGLKKAGFFLEGFGYGVLPRLMKEMHKGSKEKSSVPDENIQTALETLHDIILNTKARFCRISVDGADYSGNFLLAEVMNAQAVGPNLDLAPFADPGDGSLEVILISERQREEFAQYVLNKMNGKEQPPVFNILKAKNLDIYWEGRLLHVDDEVIELEESAEVKIKLQEGVLEFLVPEKLPQYTNEPK